MGTHRQPPLSQAQTAAEIAIASALTAGGDSLPAWNAVWDLVQSTDSHAKQEVLDALRAYVDSAAAGPSVNQARDLGNAIEHSMRSHRLHRQVLPSREVRNQYKQDQMAAHREAMQDIGVRPGEGLPMWAMYMTRRSKRTWGS